MDSLLFNAILYISLAFFYKRKNKNNVILFYLTIAYAFVAIIAFFINDTQFYTWGQYYQYGNLLRQPASYESILYVFVAYLIFIYPIKSWNNSIIRTINPIKWNMVYYFSVFSICISLIYIVLTFNTVSTLNTNDYLDIYQNAKEGQEKTFTTYIGIICNGLRSGSIILSFYLLTEKIHKYKLGVILLITTILVKYIDATLVASRGAIFFLVFELFMAFLIFKNFISHTIRKKIFITGSILIGFFISLIIAISIARFDTRIINSICSYFGESYINFSRIFWNYPGSPLHGQYTFNMILGGNEIKTNLPYGFFKTFAGSAYIDFGKIGGIIFLIIQAYCWKKILGKFKTDIDLHQLIIYHYIIIQILSGVFSLTYQGWSLYAILTLSYIYFKKAKL